ncbi:macrolide family glycosyltransferase [Actinoplanes siamensis]|uniref:Macrolide-inactivating glycosyltransferase n=1 Tax=Actinoplanes siamensis TaxID=1223317 RepID=A0A919N5Z1_9ACTN|nr:macrolide family glycosyltransferase [Actinoplanes siamensis]GIF04976.1 macrolide-inactivating glycosyltransferase [Actinoplanes siamensis]
MPHIAMVSIPFHGHVNPSLELLGALVARGHRVSYANDVSWSGAVSAIGAELKPYRSTLPRDGDGWSGDMIDQLTLFLDDAMAMLPQLRAAFHDDRPDLFLYDIAGAPTRLLGAEWGIPAIQLSPTFVAWQGYEIPSFADDPRGADYYRRFTTWLTEQDSPVTDGPSFMGRPDRGLALIPRALQPHADRVDPEVFQFVGPLLGERADGEQWTRPAGAEKVLLVSLGSAFTRHPDFYRRCIAAFGALPGWYTVLQIGSEVQEGELGEIPPSVEVRSWVPQPTILAQADAFLTHAGMGGSSEGLFHGVPMIAAPQAADQFTNAEQLAALGVGRVVDLETVTAEQLRAALVALTTDPAVAERCAALSREVRAESGVERAVGLIEAVLDHR